MTSLCVTSLCRGRPLPLLECPPKPPTGDKDTWDKVVIGDVEMKHVMACGRCILTTVDPDTGIIDRKEPLETLKSYRMCDPAQKHIHKSAPLFGSYYGIDKIGTIKKGDPVYKIIAC